MESEGFDEFVAEAMEKGWLEPVFHNDEVLIRVNPVDNNPLWQIHLESVDQDVASLLQKGMIELVGINENGEPVYELTELGEQMRNEA